MMANAGRDPYWMAGVRRETIDHPTATDVDPGRVHHLPHADDALRSEAGGRRRRGVRAPSARPGQAWRPAGRRWRVLHGVPSDRRTRISARGRVSSAASRSTRRRAPGERPRLRSVRDRQGPHDDHAFVVGLSADGGQAHPIVRAVRDVSHADHPGARRAGQRSSASCRSRCRIRSGCTATTRTTRSCQSCHMPVVEGAGADHVGVRRAA